MEDLVNEALVVELRNGKVYGGLLDEYYYDGGGVIALYSCMLLDKRNHKWVDHDIMVKSEGRFMPKYMPDFWLSDIRDIFVLPEECRGRLSLDDALQIYIDPHYRPLTGIVCHWEIPEKEESGEHSPECDARLHEALVYLRSAAHFGEHSNELRGRVEEGFAYVRRRLLMCGATIP